MVAREQEAVPTVSYAGFNDLPALGVRAVDRVAGGIQLEILDEPAQHPKLTAVDDIAYLFEEFREPRDIRGDVVEALAAEEAVEGLERGTVGRVQVVTGLQAGLHAQPGVGDALRQIFSP